MATPGSVFSTYGVQTFAAQGVAPAQRLTAPISVSLATELRRSGPRGPVVMMNNCDWCYR